jgi:hypothetical protein
MPLLLTDTYLISKHTAAGNQQDLPRMAGDSIQASG